MSRNPPCFNPNETFVAPSPPTRGHFSYCIRHWIASTFRVFSKSAISPISYISKSAISSISYISKSAISYISYISTSAISYISYMSRSVISVMLSVNQSSAIPEDTPRIPSATGSPPPVSQRKCFAKVISEKLFCKSHLRESVLHKLSQGKYFAKVISARLFCKSNRSESVLQVQRGAASAEDAQGTPFQSHISLSMLVYEGNSRENPSTCASY